MSQQVVASTIYLVRTRLHYVLVYREPPMLDRRDWAWRRAGQIHDWSRWDTLVLGFRRKLAIGRPVRCPLTTTTPSRWWFLRRGDRVALYRKPWWSPWPFVAQDFCMRMLKAGGVSDLPIGVPLYMVFPKKECLRDS